MNLRKLAAGQSCQIRLPGCNGDPATTVLAHYRLAGYCGTGMKPDDLAFGAWCCSSCHDQIDGRVKTEHDQQTIRLAHGEGVMRTVAEIRKMKAAGEFG